MTILIDGNISAKISLNSLAHFCWGCWLLAHWLIVAIVARFYQRAFFFSFQLAFLHQDNHVTF